MQIAHHRGEEPQVAAHPTTSHLCGRQTRRAPQQLLQHEELAAVVDQNSSLTSEVDALVPMSLNFKS